MASPEDNTCVIRMKRDFREFMTNKSLGTSHHSGMSGLQFDMDVSGETQQPTTMQQLFEKEEEDRLRQAELLQTKAQITKLKQQIASMETSHKRARIDFEKDINSLKQDIQKEQDKTSSVKQKFYSVASEKDTMEEELSSCRKTLETIKSTYEQRLSVLQKEKLQTEQQLTEVEQSLRQKELDSKNRVMRLEMELQISQSENSEIRKQLQAAKKKTATANQQLHEFEDCKLTAMTAQHRVKELEEQLSRVDEDVKVGKAFKVKLERLEQLEKENRQLREENAYCKDTRENIFLLKEQAESAKHKLERAEAHCAEYDQLLVKYEELQKTVQKYQLEEKSGAMSPESMQRQLSTIQSTNLVLMEKQGTLTTSAHSLEQKLRAVESENSTLKEQLINEQQQGVMRTDLIKRLQRKLLIVSKERDSIRGILNSFESDATVNLNTAMGQRVRELEAVNANYRQTNETMERDLNMAQQNLTQMKSRVYVLENQASQDRAAPVTSEVEQKRILQLTERVADLEKRLETETEAKETLEAHLELRGQQGDYDPTKTKVIHFRMNPAEVAQRSRAVKLAKLTEENEKLKTRLKLLEESGGRMEDLTMRVDEDLQKPGSSKELEDLQKQIDLSELKNKRLVEAFTKKSREFRECCYQLLGYRIDIPKDGEYKLMSMYSESPDDILMFRQGEEGDMQLLGTAYSASQMDNVQIYLEQGNSIPGFLSRITLDLYSKQTMMAS